MVCTFTVDKLVDIDDSLSCLIHRQHEDKLSNIVPLLLRELVIIPQLFPELGPTCSPHNDHWLPLARLQLFTGVQRNGIWEFRSVYQMGMGATRSALVINAYCWSFRCQYT